MQQQSHLLLGNRRRWHRLVQQQIRLLLGNTKRRHRLLLPLQLTMFMILVVVGVCEEYWADYWPHDWQVIYSHSLLLLLLFGVRLAEHAHSCSRFGKLRRRLVMVFQANSQGRHHECRKFWFGDHGWLFCCLAILETTLPITPCSFSSLFLAQSSSSHRQRVCLGKHLMRHVQEAKVDFYMNNGLIQWFVMRSNDMYSWTSCSHKEWKYLVL